MNHTYSITDDIVNYATVASDLCFPPMEETMGDRIKKLRESKDWSQSELARLLGLTRASVHQWENGSTQNIKLATFLRLVDLFGTDPQYLIWGKDRRPQAPAPLPPVRARRIP